MPHSGLELREIDLQFNSELHWSTGIRLERVRPDGHRRRGLAPMSVRTAQGFADQH
jgi:hypothetical protein